MIPNDLRREIRKRTALLVLGGAGSFVVSILVSLLAIAIILAFVGRSFRRRLWEDNGLEIVLGASVLILAGIFLIYGLTNFKKFFGRYGDDEGLFFEQSEPCTGSDGNELGRWLLFAPYMFFLGVRLFIQGLLLLFTPLDQSERLLRTLGTLGRTDVETLAKQSGISRRRVLTLLTVLDATIHTKNREVALTSAWSKWL